MDTRPLLDFKAGYVLRSLGELPRAGTDSPWHLAMNYSTDAKFLGGPVEDGALRFSRRGAVPTGADLAVAA
jgi:hypothetical protein